jgi:hypothetical protein
MTTTSDDLALVEQIARIIDPDAFSGTYPSPHVSRQYTPEHYRKRDMDKALAKASTIERLTQVKQRDSVARSPPCGEVSADAEIVAGLGAEPSAAWDRQRACDAARAASFAYGEWVPQQWLDHFFKAYEGGERGPA